MKKLLTAALLCLASSLPAMAQNEAASSITIEGNEAQYKTINAAASAAADGQTILISGEAKLTSQLLISDKGITIKGVSSDAKIVATSRNQIFKVNQDITVETTASLTLMNLEISANYTANNLILLAAGTLNLENVVINGFTSNADNGIVRIYGASNSTLENVSFENCAAPEGTPYDVMFATANGTLDIKGDCSYNLCVNNIKGKINAAGMTSGLVNLYVKSHEANAVIVEGTDDMSKLSLNSESLMLAPQDGNLVTIEYKPILVINTTDGVKTGIGYDTLESAARNATDGGKIILNEDISYTATSAPNLSRKSVEIIGNNHLLKAENASFNFFNPTVGQNITLKDLHLTWQRTTDEAVTGNFYAVTVQNTDASVTFDNVSFDNCTSTATLIRSINDGKLNIHNVSFNDCVSGSTQLITLNCAGSSISGTATNMSIQVNNLDTNSINADGLTEVHPAIVLNLRGTIPHDYVLIQGCNNPDFFALTNSKDFALQAEGDDLKVLRMEIVTGVEEVEAGADGAAEYFDLRGQRVAADALAPGFYICRKGGKATKIVVR